MALPTRGRGCSGSPPAEKAAGTHQGAPILMGGTEMAPARGEEAGVSATNPLSKRMVFHVLDVLWEETDEDHTLTLKQIVQILKNRHILTDRKTVSRNIAYLQEAGFDICCDSTRKDATVPLKTDYYLVHNFTDEELRYLIDGLVFSRHIPAGFRKDTIGKLEGLSNKYFKSRVRHVHSMPVDGTYNAEIYGTIAAIDDAIEAQRKIRFKYTEFGTDKRRHVKLREDGTERVYVATPYQMAARDGKYYLICNYDRYDDVSNYRVDRMVDVEVLEDEPARPFEDLDWSGGRPLDLAEYMREHPYMYSSEDVRARLRVTLPMVSDVIDLFGEDVEFSDEDREAGTVCVGTRANARAVQQFAKNFAPDVLLLEPAYLRERVADELRRATEAYSKLEK